MKKYNPRRIRPSQNQRLSRRLIIITGLASFALALGSVIYFQFSNSEESKADEAPKITADRLPDELIIDSPVLLNTDTLHRNGLRYKIARPISDTPSLPQK